MEAAKAEKAAFEAQVKDIEEWWKSERFQFTNRPYSAREVASFRASQSIQKEPQSNFVAKKFYQMCRERFNQGKFVHTFGCLDPVQVVQMAQAGVEAVYVSGWQCSSTASSSNEPGPDFADYPANTVPNKVDQLFKMQVLQDRRQNNERANMSVEELAKTPKVDYLRPIIADGDTGFGGMTSVMKLMKMMIEAGAAAVHIEDQKPGAKKCGHMGGKVLVPVREQCDRLAAFRLQADIMGVETVVISRTDAESATFLENNIDFRDHPYIAGCTNPDIGTLEDAKDKDAWTAAAGLCRYTEAVARAMKKAGKENLVAKWTQDSMQLSNKDARALAASLGFGDVFWCWEAPKSREGYFQVIGGLDYSAARAIAFSDCADLIWMETATPNVADAAQFAKTVHAVKPHQMLSYNLSPSFNWDAAGMDDNAIKQFQHELGKVGFVYHFITLAGFHTNALAITHFSRAYAGPDGVFAYVRDIQRQEREHNVSTLTHQHWSSISVKDKEMMAATGGGASTAASEGSTEDQFKAKL